VNWARYAHWIALKRRWFFSNALNETILQKQKKTKDNVRPNLLLSMSKWRFIFASCINSCKNESYISKMILIIDEPGGSQPKRQTYGTRMFNAVHKVISSTSNVDGIHWSTARVTRLLGRICSQSVSIADWERSTFFRPRIQKGITWRDYARTDAERRAAW
jgi:beta-lactamase class A